MISDEASSPIGDRIKLSSNESEGEGFGEIGDQWTEVISWEPTVFLYHNFLSKEECEYLINLAKPHLTRSMVVDRNNVNGKESSARTSSGMFLRRGQDKVIRDIEKRIADYLHIPVEHGENMQILCYEASQKFDPHYDFFADEFNIKNGGQRIATLLMYLSDVEEGGETVFPKAKGKFSSVPGKSGLSIKPKMGNALLFWSTHPDATVDYSSWHGSCPVIKGKKWSATKWMHLHEYKIY